MKKLIDAVYGVAITLMFGGCLLADGLGQTAGGFVALFIIIGVAGALILFGNRLEDEERRRRRSRARRAGR